MNGGVKSVVNRNGMTRAPLVRFESAQRASAAKLWLEEKDNFDLMAEAFNGTSRYVHVHMLICRCQKCKGNSH